MSQYDDFLRRSQELQVDEKLIKEDMSKIIDENKRVQDIADNSEELLNEIDKKFATATKLDKKDFAFLFFAVAMQCIRQYCFTSFKERTTHDKSEKEAKKEEKNKFRDKYGNVTDTGEGNRYNATLGDIIIKGVPYDVQFGSGDFNLGLGGNEHRYKTLGHDPLLGWVFGTANIMTSTLTNWQLQSYHVEPAAMSNGSMKAKIVEKAKTTEMFEKVRDRVRIEPVILGAALIKQRFHIKSDEFSIAGLPIAGSIMLSPEFSMELAKYGLDAGNLKTVGKQFTYSVMINMIIAMIHRMVYDEVKCGPLDLYVVKTRKIIMYSNVIASASNIITVAIESAIKGKPDLKHLDIGGIAVTLYRIVSDTKFIENVKEEFIYNNFNSLVQGEEYTFNID